ncbi:MAG: DUF4393 domain-containing protein [Flavobacteriaceae bacterium]|jgi:hypothetical protein|nr:DUF4393 domain-containing protein [Flavobacteriaceae bacterium]
MQKIDITSTALEKGLDIAKGFVEKLIYPSAEEMGLLLKDGIAKWRFSNQVKTLIKAQSICEKHGVNPQMISPKLLTPLLEYASLEDNEKLQDKWATLLANMVDSDQNVENHVFPYLLSQVSIQEFELLEKTLNIKIERVKSLNVELGEYLKEKDQTLTDLTRHIEVKQQEIETRKSNNINNPGSYKGYWELENELRELNSKKYSFERKQARLERAINEPELLTQIDLRDYEISNLIRLGVVKEIIRSYGYVDNQRVSVSRTHDYESEDYVSLDDLSVTIETDVIEYELTELGELFIKACQEKK